MPVDFYDITRTARVSSCNGVSFVTVSDRPLFRAAGWEQSDKWDSSPRSKKSDVDTSADNVLRSQRRARLRLKELATCNDFSYFVTLTLDKEKIDRYDFSVILKKLKNWLDNRVRRCGLCYILVPERHKDGAIHFHGFFNDSLPVVDSGHTDKHGHVVYNLPGWSFGFSTAISLYGDYLAAVGYVCKYIAKDSEKIGGRWYYSGGDLRQPSYSYFNVDFDAAAAFPGAYVSTVPAVGCRIIKLTFGDEKSLKDFLEKTQFTF